jgi:hypothetical protein
MARIRNPRARHTGQSLDYCCVVEGHCEFDYLKTVLGIMPFKPHKPSPPIAVTNPDCTDLPNLLQEALRHLGGKLGYPHVYVVFDADAITPEQAEHARQFVQQHSAIRLLCSNPTFEYVLRLHFDANSHKPHRDDYGNNCLKPFGFPDHKSSNRTNLMEHLRDNPEQVKAACRAMQQQDSTTFGQPVCPTLNDRLSAHHAPNSNMYEVIQRKVSPSNAS